ncbi:MAG TPA: hypothetical protein GX696_11255 [Pseudomonadaceae bacterium]|nr:hypothetical protein [Pseudomonadaceae bacterium]
MNKISSTLLAGLLLWSLAGSAAACDRECLRGHVTQYLHALVAHDHSGLPLAEDVRFTENSVEEELGAGLWRTATKLRGYRQDFIDEREGVVGSHVVLEESGAPTLLVLRLKVVDDLITEIETVTTRSRVEGALFNLDNLALASAEMQFVPKPEQLETREEAIRIAALYPAGLKEGSFVTVDLPYTPDAYRLENGEIMAGPECTRFPTCNNIKTQDVSPGRTTIDQRLIAVDERLGIVWYRLSWERGEDTRLVVWEAFKVYDGQMHAVEAFMKLIPKELGSGWE